MAQQHGFIRHSDHIYAQLRQELCDGTLVAGDRLHEQALARRFAASRTPIREALTRLQQDGLVQVALRSGWRVTAWDFQRLRDAYDLRIILESEAVRRLAAMATIAPLIGELREQWASDGPAPAWSAQTMADQDEYFHLALVQTMANAEVERIYGALVDRLRLVRQLDFELVERREATCREHCALLEAIIDGHGRRAVSLLERHIAQAAHSVEGLSEARLREALKQRG